ncbi:putative glycosyltransferase [Lentisphaera araneosa HTCC2155]|uniref:Putative glycosyltransferase n=1 Tax=Lentisphaera araneosa HTCC2155 TaxID=313628 RepID=A6DQG8_9BACT|nr:glycosyltransferase family 2 protein [Lentisphaera araneosa]EDM26049.1 putative glycosyltransferase [Lentisphaera araneosa HTCC2155]
MPLISIITVTYNCCHLIDQTTKSILLQDFNNYEYIIVDGNSEDGTQEKIKSTLLKFKVPTKFISEKDKGVYDAMNKAINLCSGQYVIFMNAGDSFYSSETLNFVSATLSEKTPDVLFGDHALISKNKETRYIKAKNLSNLWKRMVFCHQSMFTKRNLLIKNPFEVTNLAADHTLIYKLYMNQYYFEYTPKTLANYLDDGLSVQHYRKSILDRFIGVYKHTKPTTIKIKLIAYYLIIYFLEPLKYKLSKLLR